MVDRLPQINSWLPLNTQTPYKQHITHNHYILPIIYRILKKNNQKQVFP